MINFSEVVLGDFLVIGFLVFLEGVLSLDNALVLAMLVRPLPEPERKRALTYGLVGAVVFRLGCLAIINQLIRWTWIKFVGSAYLIFLAGKHLLRRRAAAPAGDAGRPAAARPPASFWSTVIRVELLDAAFAVDSILAAVAVSNRLWVVFTGGVLGIVLMRMAAGAFVRLLERYPGFERSAYALVFLIGVKIGLEGLGETYHLAALNFHAADRPSFWIFWLAMAATIAMGFRRPTPKSPAAG